MTKHEDSGIIEIFLHRERSEELLLVEIQPEDHAADLAGRHMGEDVLVWIENSDDPLEPTSMLIEIGIREHDHIHMGRCRVVDVSVRYGGDTKEKRFSPSTTIEAVFAWATGAEGFLLTAEQRAKHSLGLCNTTVEPDRGSHVGSLATECRLCLDLAPKERFQG